ncbi:MAG: OmpH family outer membrane protein [Acidobacteria bacterium]|nr:MAG: OmpH family outer membrane protein [Acidobacteriota bacterium]
MSASVIRRLLFVLVLMVIAAGIVRASLDGFNAKREAIIAACQAERARLGIKSDDVLFSKYPTPEITLITTACVPAAGTGELVVKGKFVPGSKFLLQSDSLEVVKEALTGTEYRATIKAPAAIGPEVADIFVFSPVSGASAHGQKAVVVSGKFEWDLQSANGWRITARPAGPDTRCKSNRQSIKYNLEFFRGAEKVPFQKRQGELYFSAYSQNPYQLRVEEERPAEDLQAQVQALSEKMMSPSLSDAERDKLMTQLQTLSQKMVAQMSDMAAVQKQAQQLEQRKKEFGCETLELRIEPGSKVQGEMHCGQLVGRGIDLNGTVNVGPIS